MPKRKQKHATQPPSNEKKRTKDKDVGLELDRNGGARHEAIDDNQVRDFSEAIFSSPDEAFSQLIHPMKMETFMAEYWEKKPLILSNRGPEHASYFQSLFTRGILERLVAEKKISFVRDCNVCRYKDGVRESLNGNGSLKPNKLKELLDKARATVQFHQPQRFQGTIWRLLEKLETYFGCLVGSNVYMTPKLSQGLAPHYDDVEVFVLQLEGEKHWRLYKPPTLLPRDYSRDLDQSEIGKPTHDILLKAGDVMYFPRGTVHQADTPGTCAHSTHLTISTYQRSSWGDLLSIALPSIIQTAISDDVSYRQGLPLRFASNPSHQASSNDTTKKMEELISQLNRHIGSHGQEAANEILCDFIANRLPPFCHGEPDIGPHGPMPSSANQQVRFHFPDHTYVVRRQIDDDEEGEEEEEDEEEEKAEEEKVKLFVYHSLRNSHQDHMMSSEPREALGIQLPKECEPALRALQKNPGSWRHVKDIKLVDSVRSQMVTSLWAEGLLEVRHTKS